MHILKNLHLFPGVKSGAEVNIVEADPGMEIIGLEVALVKHCQSKALRTQALTVLTSNFGLVGLVQYAW